MKQHRIEPLLLAAGMALAMPLAALAQSGTPPSQTPPASAATGLSNAQAALGSTSPSDQASAEADAKAKAEAQAKLDAILARGAKTSSKTRAEAETKLAATTRKVDDAATKEGDAKVAERLGAEFGMSTEAMIAEKQSLGASWGELMITQTLANNSGGLTADQIYQMRQDGKGWGQIAAGLGLRLGDVVSATQAEGRVATGLAKPEGKAPQIRGAEASAHNANGVGAKAGAPGVGAKVGASVGSNVDVKVKPGRP